MVTDHRNHPATSPVARSPVWNRRRSRVSPWNLASSAESVGTFRFRESSQVVIESNFHSVIGAEAVGSSGDQSDFVVETLNGTIGDFFFCSKPVQDQGLMGAQHAGYLFHRFQT